MTVSEIHEEELRALAFIQAVRDPEEDVRDTADLIYGTATPDERAALTFRLAHWIGGGWEAQGRNVRDVVEELRAKVLRQIDEENETENGT